MRTASTNTDMDTLTEPGSFVGRPTCYRCFRPLVVCYCDAAKPIEHDTRVVIVQHPREIFHPLNTARLAELCLSRVDVLRGDLPDLDAAFRSLGLPEKTALLYPSQDSVDIDELTEDERPECIVVIDGTWSQARALNRRLPSLAQLRRVRFTPPAPSEYRIRREPRADYLSTVESIALMLGRLEPGRVDAEGLRETFRTMIDRNLAARSRGNGVARQKRPTPERAVSVPSELLVAQERVVVLYAEAAPDPDKVHPKHPFVVCAGRFGAPTEDGGGAELCAVMRMPFEAHVVAREAHALDENDASAALSRDELARAFAEFRGERDVVVAWNESSHQVLAEALGADLAELGLLPVTLKSAYCNLRGREVRKESLRRGAPERASWGSLGDVTRREGMTITSRGRARRRLEETTWILELVRNAAPDTASED